MASGLTKHYYAVDEVRAALAYACKEHKQEDAVFWCNELLVSNMDHLALETLLDTWLWTYGPCRLFWLVSAQHTDLDRLPRLAQYLASLEHTMQDGSLWVILRETTEQPDRIVGWGGAEELMAKAEIPFTSQPLAKYFITAAKEYKASSAWWAAAQLGIDNTLALACLLRPERASWLQTIAHSHMPGYEKALHCMVALVASMWDDIWLKSIKPMGVPNEIPIARHKSPREARAYKIPTICLYGITARGKMRTNETTLPLLRDIEQSLTGMYWNTEIAKYGGYRDASGKLNWKSDEDKEEFYERYFADDIPDEWPLAEQMKSHGPGVVGPSEIMTLDKQMRIWIPRRQRLCWQKVDVTDDLVGPLADLALEGSGMEVEGAELKPVRKLKVIGTGST
jgi:hypothetical protein